MFSITPISLFNVNITLGPSVTGIGHLGGTKEDRAGTIERLGVPWHDLPPNPPFFSLLSWHTRLSNFTGRGQELAELEDWAAKDHAVLVKFLSGQGGLGKSRLAAYFAETLSEHGWAAGFVDLRKPISFPTENKGTLLVVDYPEEYHERIIEFLRDLAMLSPVSKVRVLFLTRRSIDDWTETFHIANATDIVDARSLTLSNIQTASGYSIYCSALEQSSTALNTTPPPLSEDQFGEWIELSSENRLALFIMAAAVHSAMYPQDLVVRYTGKEVIKILVEREVARLTRIAKGMKEEDLFVFARLSAIAALAGDISIQQAKRLAESPDLTLGFRSRPNMEAHLRDSGILQGGYIPAPKPDIPAAAFAVTVLAKDVVTAPSLVWSALASDIEGGLNRIARLSYDAEIVLGLYEHRLSNWLAGAVDGQSDRCNLLEPFFLEDTLPLGWINAAVSVWRTLLRAAPGGEKRARLLNNLSIPLSDAGDNAAALKANQEAVELYRRLAQANPARSDPDLAHSLNNLSIPLSEVGDNAAALMVIQEAMELNRRLAQPVPD